MKSNLKSQNLRRISCNILDLFVLSSSECILGKEFQTPSYNTNIPYAGAFLITPGSHNDFHFNSLCQDKSFASGRVNFTVACWLHIAGIECHDHASHDTQKIFKSMLSAQSGVHHFHTRGCATTNCETSLEEIIAGYCGPRQAVAVGITQDKCTLDQTTSMETSDIASKSCQSHTRFSISGFI